MEENCIFTKSGMAVFEILLSLHNAITKLRERLRDLWNVNARNKLILIKYWHVIIINYFYASMQKNHKQPSLIVIPSDYICLCFKIQLFYVV